MGKSLINLFLMPSVKHIPSISCCFFFQWLRESGWWKNLFLWRKLSPHHFLCTWGKEEMAGGGGKYLKVRVPVEGDVLGLSLRSIDTDEKTKRR